MNLLIDTHVVLWSMGASHRLSAETRSILADSDHAVILSAVSVAEISIKVGLGKLKIDAPVDEFLDRFCEQWRIRPLPLTRRHCQVLADLPLHHRDPFDRMLITQAMTEGFTLVSADDSFAAYPIDLHNA